MQARQPLHVALSGEFYEPDGSPAWPGFDMTPLENEPRIRFSFLPPTEQILPEHVADVDALILLHNRVSEASFHPNGRLAVIARFGAGYDLIDVDACTRRHVPLVTTPGGVRRPMATAILTLMLALTTKLTTKIGLAREGAAGYAKRPRYMGQGLAGKTLGSIGLGNIGSELFRLAAPLDMTFIASDPHVNPAHAQALGVQLVDPETLFSQADVLVVNCPVMPETHHLVGAEQLARMKPTAYLINTARGPIVDQAALTQALLAGQIAGAALDVLEFQPPSPDDPLLHMENVIVTPNALGWTDELCRGNGAGVTRCMLELLEGRMSSTVINSAVLSTAEWKARLQEIQLRAAAFLLT